MLDKNTVILVGALLLLAVAIDIGFRYIDGKSLVPVIGRVNGPAMILEGPINYSCPDGRVVCTCQNYLEEALDGEPPTPTSNGKKK